MFSCLVFFTGRRQKYEACPESEDTNALHMYNTFNLRSKATLGMNFLYITLFFNIVARIVQTFIKSWNQLR